MNPQKRNKIIVLVSLIIIIIFSSYYIFINLRERQQESMKGSICVHVGGQSWDSKIIDDIAFPNIELQLFKRNDLSNLIEKGTTDVNGDYCFLNLSSPDIYWIEINSNVSPASYYLPYQHEILLPYKTPKVTHYIKLFLNDAAQRDIKRQNLMYLYQSVLEDYKIAKGKYPLSPKSEKIIDTNANLILLLKPYLEKRKFDINNLLDPIKDRPIIYWSDKTNYQLFIYPEIVTNISLFNSQDNTYFISH